MPMDETRRWHVRIPADLPDVELAVGAIRRGDEAAAAKHFMTMRFVCIRVAQELDAERRERQRLAADMERLEVYLASLAPILEKLSAAHPRELGPFKGFRLRRSLS